jgi:hypothetical protein
MVLMDDGEIKTDSTPKEVFATSLLEETGVKPPRIVELHKRITPKPRQAAIPLTVEEAVEAFLEGKK